MGKNFLNVMMLVGFMGAGAFAQAQEILTDGSQNAQFNDGVLHLDGGPDAVTAFQESIDSETGYHLNPTDLSASFIVKPEVQRAFAGASKYKTNLPKGMLPASFKPIIADIADHIDKVAASNNEQKNGISNNGLATKIVRLSFCFGTDPYVVMAQIEAESTFDRTKRSGTGAVGLTQLTSDGIDEVNDQFGNHGDKGANLDALPFLQQAISCYTGGARFTNMMQAGAISQGTVTARNAGASARAKNWIRGDIDRQLIYGQIFLKVSLARARARGSYGSSAYTSGLRDYNGDRKHNARNKYRAKIMRTVART